MRGHSRAILSEMQANDIYVLKTSNPTLHISSSVTAQKYGVSPKTIRDIWNGRTWRHITHMSNFHLTLVRMKCRKEYFCLQDEPDRLVLRLVLQKKEE